MTIKLRTILPIGLILLCFVLISHKPLPVYLDESKPLEERVEDALSRMTMKEKIDIIHAQAKFSSAGVPRLGIPELWMSDGPHGIRMEIQWGSWDKAGWTNDSCTAFPALTGLAATFNPRLARLYGRTLGQESRYRRKDVVLGPGVNIYRHPMNGRNFEYMGEDPYLASQMVIPYVQGMQENGVAACVKHYALNNQEKWRHEVDVDVSDRALYEIYLPAFKAAVDGGVWTIMGAYNKYRGQHTTHNERLMNKILKEDWAFDGAVISDWGSTHNVNEAALYGLDIEMGTGTNGLSTEWVKGFDAYYLGLPFMEKIQNGELAELLLDDKARRVLRLMFRTVMDRNRPLGSLASPEHAEVSRKIAEQAIVLLKNDKSILPIPVGKYSRIAVIGENATKPLTVGGGSSELKVKKEVSPLEGIISKYGEQNVKYSLGYTLDSGADAAKLLREALELAKNSDVVIYVGGLNKESHQDNEGVDRNSYGLPYGQDELIEGLLEANPNTCVVLISGNAVAMPWISKASAVIQSWYLGSEAGNATANVLAGDVNPSGKLPFSIPVKFEDNGAIHFGEESYPGLSDSKKQIYKEDILVGYRWHDTKRIPALFPFGYGLSYTQFEYGKAESDKKEYGKDDVIEVSFTLTNQGERDGAETVQVYASQNKPSLYRPAKELKAFDKVFLKAGESKEVKLEIPVNNLAFYDDTKGKWIVESDKFTLHCAASSTDIKSSVTVKVK